MVSGGCMETNMLNLWRWRAVRTCLGSSARFMQRGICVKDARTWTYTFLPASWVGDTHVETDILPIGDWVEMGWVTLLNCHTDSPGQYKPLWQRTHRWVSSLETKEEVRQQRWIASMRGTRTSLGLIVHTGAVFICPGYAHGPSSGTYWKVMECGWLRGTSQHIINLGDEHLWEEDNYQMM